MAHTCKDSDEIFFVVNDITNQIKLRNTIIMNITRLKRIIKR